MPCAAKPSPLFNRIGRMQFTRLVAPAAGLRENLIDASNAARDLLAGGRRFLKEVEGGGTYGLPETEFKNLLQANGLNIISVGADFDELAKDPQIAINEAKKYGAKYVVCFWIPHKDEFTLDDAKKAVKKVKDSYF